MVVRIRVHIRREVDGMERLGRLHLFDLATPESCIPSSYSAVEADEAKDVAVSIFRLGTCTALAMHVYGYRPFQSNQSILACPCSCRPRGV